MNQQHVSASEKGEGLGENLPVEVEPEVRSKPKRLRSLDALRGFDMFWIVGGSGVAASLAKYTEWEWVTWFSGQLRHPGWEGFAFFDLIFPLFLFLAGVSMPFSLGRQIELGKSKFSLVRKVFVRAILLILLGVIYNNRSGLLAFKPIEETRYCSVLGFIGIAYFFAAMVYIFSNLRHHIIWTLGILIGYWIALYRIEVPGIGANVLTPQGAFTAYIDRSLLPWKFDQGSQLYDSEGLFPTISAISTALLGCLTGQFIRAEKFNKFVIAAILLAAGAGFYYFADFLQTKMFISKHMWNPPFVLHCAGWSLLLLGLFYLIIDAIGFWHWAFFFIVIGMNSITVYLGTMMVNFRHTSNFFFSGMIQKIEDNAPLQNLYHSLGYVFVWWVVLLFLYRKKIFLRV